MKLSRAALGLPTPKANLVHLGIGAFFRAHQAWYTQVAEPQGAWGYVAFTGRSAQVAEELGPQDGLYTLITRGPEGDDFEVINSIASVKSGSDLDALVAAVRNPETAVITLTITEAGYCLNPDGSLVDASVLLASLTSGNPSNAITRLAWALNQRRITNGLGLALVPCDNIPANGTLLRGAMDLLFSAFGSDAQQWLKQSVSFVSTSVDRITPKTTTDDLSTVASATGYLDESPVVTEPFRDWVLEGSFPLGRPAWEQAGAKFVEHIEPFENRKLWLLNGSHSLLAYLGQLRGHATVDQAIADPECLAAVERFWDEAERTLDNPSLDIAAYRAALLNRYRNPRIAHQLAQIAIDGATKIRVRIVPTLIAERAKGNGADGALEALAAWIAYVLETESPRDALAEQLAAAKNVADQVLSIRNLLAILDPDLATDESVVARLVHRVSALRNPQKGN